MPTQYNSKQTRLEDALKDINYTKIIFTRLKDEFIKEINSSSLEECTDVLNQMIFEGKSMSDKLKHPFIGQIMKEIPPIRDSINLMNNTYALILNKIDSLGGDTSKYPKYPISLDESNN